MCKGVTDKVPSKKSRLLSHGTCEAPSSITRFLQKDDVALFRSTDDEFVRLKELYDTIGILAPVTPKMWQSWEKMKHY